MSPATSVRATLSRSLRQIVPLVLAFATATCTQDNTGPSEGGMGYFTFRPSYVLPDGASLAQFGIVADSIHIRLTRPVDQLVLDTALFFPPDSTELHLALPLTLQQSPDTIDAIVEISSGGVVIFRDSIRTEVLDGPPSAGNIPTVVFDYVGPGTEIKSIDIVPQDSTVFLGDTVDFTATALDSLDAPVASFYVSWRTSDTAVAKINANGRLIAPNNRATVQVIGTTPTNIADTTTITFAPTPVIITADSGNGQSGQVNDSLPALFVARVKAADSLGVAGIPVQFAVVTAGGAIRDTLLFTDSTGRVRTRGVLGITVGAYSWTATALGTGLPARTFSATATAGLPAGLALISGNGQVDTVANLLPAPFVVKVIDGFNNPVPGAAVVFTRTFGSGVLADDTVFADAGGLASVGYTLGNTIGTDSVTATIPGTSATFIFNTTAVAAGPAVIQEFGGGAQTAVVNGVFAESLLVKVFDSHDNPVIGAKVVWSIFAGQGSVALDTTLTDSTGSTRNELTAGTLAGVLQVEARPVALANGLTITNTVIAGPAASLTIAGGNDQTAAAGSALALPPQVHVVDAFGNVKAGIAVDFAVTLGGGTVDSATATTDSAGDANAGVWTLGAVAGGHQLRATSAAVPADTLLFDATALPLGTTKLWTGTVDNLWSTAGNWSPSGMPVGGDNIFIPAGAISPLLDTPTITGGLSLESGATLTVSSGVTLQLSGNLAIDGTVDGAGNIALTGSGATVRGTLNTSFVLVNGTLTLNGATNIGGALNLNTGSLTVGGQTLTVDSILTVGGSGQLLMTNAADSVDVAGNVTFSTTTTGTGKLSNGVLVLRGDFSQSSGSTTSFAPSGTHRTRFLGAGVQTVNFANPGSATSRFWDVEFGSAAGTTLNSTFTAMGIVTANAGTVTGIGRTANIGGGLATSYATWQVSTTLWGQDPTVYPDSLPRNVNAFNGWNLTKPFKADSNLVINSTGVVNLNGHTLRIGGSLTQGGQLKMQNTTDTLKVGGNFTVNSATSGVSDLTAGELVIGGNFLQTAGATTNFAPVAAHTTRFAGGASQSITFGNPGLSLFGAVVFDNLLGITLGSDIAAVGTATVSQGVVNGAARTAQIGGNLAASNSAWIFGTTNFTGTPSVFPGAMTGNVFFQNGATLFQPFSVSGGITVFSGFLDINGETLTVGGNLSFTGSGQIQMVNAADSVDVGGYGINSTTSSDGHLTAGILYLRSGGLTAGVSSQSFRATGTHRTRFAGTSAQTMSFSFPDTGSSRFQILELANTATVTANSDIAVAGQVTINDGVLVGIGRTAFMGSGGIVDTAGGRWNIGTTVFQENPAVLPIGLPGNVIWRASGSLSQSLTVAGAFTIDEDTLYLGGHALQVVGDLTVGGTGALPLVTPSDSLIALGNVLWSTSVPHSALLTSGYFLFQKNFTQVIGATDNFAAGAGVQMQLVTTGTAPQLTFDDPVNSHFGSLEVFSTNGLDLVTDVAVAGQFSEGGGITTNISSGSQHTLTVGGLDVNGATFDQVNIVLHSATNSVLFDAVTFVNQDPAITQLALEFPGQAGDTLHFNNVTFDGVPTTGRYVAATDNATDGAVANIGFYNSFPMNGSAFTTVAGGDTPNVLWSHLEWQTEPVLAVEGVIIFPAPEVRAVDPSGVVMTGYTNTITLSFGNDPSGGAAVLAGNTADPSNGVGTFSALTISLAGSGYTLRPSSPELGLGPESSPFTIDIPIPVGTTTAFNNAGGDNDWDNALNWSGGVPDSTDNVFIISGQTANVGTPSRANRIQIGSGGSIVLNSTLTVDSTVAAGNTISGGGSLIAQGSGELSGQVGDLVVTGAYTVPSGDQLNAQYINISGASAALDPGQAMITADSLRTEAGGRLNIGYPGAQVNITGSVRFTGGASSLVSGKLQIGGDFSQEENVGAFSAESTFTTEFNGGGTQSATFFSPDTLSDHFGRVGITNGGTLHLVGYVPIMGDLDISGGTIIVDSLTLVGGGISGSTGAFLQGRTLQVAGNLGFGGVYNMGYTVFAGAGQTILPLSSGYDTLAVTGTALLGGTITANAVYVYGDGQLSMGGRRMDVAGDFATGNNGVFGMQDPADTLVIGGNFGASGGPTTGLLTAGLLQISGNFIQGLYTGGIQVEVQGPPPAGNAFDAAPGHTTRLVGGALPRLVYFSDPVQPPGSGSFFVGPTSKFGDLELVDGTDTLASVVPVSGGALVSTASVIGDGTLAVVGFLNVGAGVPNLSMQSLYTGGGMTYGAAPASYQVNETFYFGGDSIRALPYKWLRVGFASMPLAGDVTADQVTLGGQGEGPSDSYDGRIIMAGHTLTTTGDFNVAGHGTLQMDHPTDSLDVGGNFDYSGDPSTDLIDNGVIYARGQFSMSANWQDSGFVATGENRLVMAAAGSTQLNVFGASAQFNLVNRLFVKAGTLVNFNPFSPSPLVVADTFWVNGFFVQGNPGKKIIALGDLYAGFSAGITVDTVEVHKELEIDASNYSTQLTRYAGTGQVIATNVGYLDVEVTGTAALDSNLTSVGRDLSVREGTLDLGGHLLQVGRDFLVADSGLLVMTNDADTLDVGYGATFNGRASEGSLTAGVIRTNYFTQGASWDLGSFRPTGTHVVHMKQEDPADQGTQIFFASGGASDSRFNKLFLDSLGTNSGVYLTGHVEVADTFYAANGSTGGINNDNLPATFRVNGATVINQPFFFMTVDTFDIGGTLQIPTGMLGSPVTRFSGVGQFIPDTQSYNRLEITGTASPESGTAAISSNELVVYGTGRLTVINGSLVNTNDLTTADLGTIEMAGPVAQLHVFNNAVFDGGSTAGLLRQGFFTLDGNLTQDATNSPASFAVDSQMNTIFTNPAGQFITLATPGNSGSHFGFMNIQTNAVVNLNAPGTIPVWGELHINNGASLNSNAGIDVAQNMTSNSGTSVSAPLFIFRNGSAPDGSSPWNVGRTVIATPDTMNIPQLTYGGDLEIWTQGRFVYPVTINGTLRVGGNGAPAYASWSGVTVNTIGLDVIDNSRFGMQTSGDVLNIAGAAHFDGGYLADQLTGGAILFGGDVTQDSTWTTQSFGYSGTDVQFTPGTPHKLAFASPDNSPFPQLLSSGAGGLTLQIVGRIVAQGGGVNGNGIDITGDTLDNSGPLSGSPSPISLKLLAYRGTTPGQFENISVWDVGTTQFTVGGTLPNFDFAFDTLLVSDEVTGQLSQLLKANYVEVTGPGNPKHTGDNPGRLVLSGGDGNTDLQVSGDVVVRGDGAGIASFEGSLSTTGDFTVDQKGYIYSGGSFGGGFWNIGGNVLFDGASTQDSLVRGNFVVNKDFTQKGTTSGTSFAPNSTFTTTIAGTGTHSVSFENPTPRGGGGSQFGELAFEQDAGIVMKSATDLWVEGTLTTAGYNNPVLMNTDGALRTITVREVNIQGVTFDHYQLHLENSVSPGSENMDIVNFTNFLTTEDQFLITLPGKASSGYSFSNFTFTQLDLGGTDAGHYVVASDFDGNFPFLGVSIGTNQASVGELGYYLGQFGATLNPFAP